MTTKRPQRKAGQKGSKGGSQRSPDNHEGLMSAMAKKYGAGALIKGAQRYGLVEGVPTGSILLDEAIGTNGVPKGRITEIYGREGSGKSTLAIHIMSNAMKRGGAAAYVDAEHALDPVYAGRCGLDLEELLLSQPESAEEALNITEGLVESGEVDVVVVDSVAALVPLAELEAEVGQTFVAPQARLMGQSMRKLAGKTSRSRVAVIFINQLRDTPGVTWGAKETTPGGRALKFFASVRIELKQIKRITDGNKVIGNRVVANVQKNKVSRPFRSAEFEIIFNEGISQPGEMIDLGLEEGILQQQRGSRYYWGETYLGHGRERAKQFLRKNPEAMEELHELVITSRDTAQAEPTDADDDGRPSGEPEESPRGLADEDQASWDNDAGGDPEDED